MSENSTCPMLSVSPSRGLVDEKFQVVVQNLLPRQEVTLHALMRSEDDDLWEAFGHYVSDAKGAVKVADDVSVGGSYEGMEPMGLLWSMRPVPGSRTGLRLRKKDVTKPMVVHISVYWGHVSQGFTETTALACTIVERWYMAPGIQRVEVSEDGIIGTLFLPAGPGPFPGILDLWGGGGGLVEYRSALLASHGYAALALEYMSPKTMSEKAQVGNQYFEAAFRFLQEHPQVCADRVAMFGLSFGTSVVLGIAVYSTMIQPKCLVCVSGSHVQPVRGSLADVLKEIAKNQHKTRYDNEKRVIWRDLLLPIPSDPNKKVDMGQLRCPLLFIFGEDDQNWPASESAQDMGKMMKESGNSHLLTVLSYADAGHLIEPPYTPHVRSGNFMTVQQVREKVVVLWGGHAKGHAHAQEDSWQKTLAFLEQHLYTSTDHVAPSPQ